jgi:hypothetical protein
VFTEAHRQRAPGRQLAKGHENQGVAEWRRASGEIDLTSGAVEAVQLDDPERACLSE